jgi:hypothetical protein
LNGHHAPCGSSRLTPQPEMFPPDKAVASKMAFFQDAPHNARKLPQQ